MKKNKKKWTSRLALHSTHEAAEKIAGIGAVLDGILPEEQYQEAFSKSLLAGPYHFPETGGMLNDPSKWKTLFDSEGGVLEGGPGGLSRNAKKSLLSVARRFGTRIMVGTRCVGGTGTWVDVLLVSPQGINHSELLPFRDLVRDRFHFHLSSYEHYPALDAGVDASLERIFRKDPNLAGIPDRPLLDSEGKPLFGGVHFLDGRAVFPRIQALDSFHGFERANHYLVELQFYFFSAPPLWEASKVLIREEWKLDAKDVTFFAHDWLGVPLFWAMILDGFLPARSVYFAHEARICRLLVEGVLRSRIRFHKPKCHPDGYDTSFYSYLHSLDSKTGLSTAFPGSGGFKDIFYHEINRQAVHFHRIAAVGRNVMRETELILRNGKEGSIPPISLCPNGIYDLHPSERAVSDSKERLRAFALHHFGFSPDFIFTSVSRCELSKAPWRNVEFFRTFAKTFPDKKVLFLWLSRPKPLPTPEEMSRWKAWTPEGWPLDHRPREKGGDLRKEEEALWGMIQKLNADFKGSYRIVYVNQFGWSEEKNGALHPLDTSFLDLRMGTDAELGLSIYEPFGIAALEPFSSGAVCVVSDACGCASHLSELSAQGKMTDEGFVIGRFTWHFSAPGSVDLEAFQKIQNRVYSEMAEELFGKLDKDRSLRLAAARKAMPLLSWKASVSDYLLPALA